MSGFFEHCLDSAHFHTQCFKELGVPSPNLAFLDSEVEQGIYQNRSMVECAIEEQIVEVQVIRDLGGEFLPFPLCSFGNRLLHLIKAQAVACEAYVAETVKGK